MIQLLPAGYMNRSAVFPGCGDIHQANHGPLNLRAQCKQVRKICQAENPMENTKYWDQVINVSTPCGAVLACHKRPARHRNLLFYAGKHGHDARACSAKFDHRRKNTLGYIEHFAPTANEILTHPRIDPSRCASGGWLGHRRAFALRAAC